MLQGSKHALLVIVLAFTLVGCEQRPSDRDPPPTTPADRTPDTQPPLAAEGSASAFRLG